MEKDKRGLHRLTWLCLALWLFQFPAHSSASYMVYWSAVLEIQYLSPGANHTTTTMCECGWYGVDSPRVSAFGYVALPTSDPLACSPNTSFSVKKWPWIALIKRGNCSYADKIRAAIRKKASAVVIYNYDGAGNATTPMSHQGVDEIVAITISNNLGKEISSQVESGTVAYMYIEVGKRFKSIISPIWVYILTVTLFGMSAVILGYFIINCIYKNIKLWRQQRGLKKGVQRAISKLQVRTLRRNDPEVEAEENNCAVCIDPFKRGDIVTTLPCCHLFHKTCIEPWLLKHHTCPMCKYDILKAELGVEPQEPTAPTEDVRFYPSSVSASLAETPAVVTSLEQHVETRSRLDVESAEDAIPMSDHVRRKEHIYENPAFEVEQQMNDHPIHQV